MKFQTYNDSQPSHLQVGAYTVGNRYFFVSVPKYFALPLYSVGKSSLNKCFSDLLLFGATVSYYHTTQNIPLGIPG